MDVPKNAGEVIRIQPRRFQGYDLVDIRVWFKADAQDDKSELRPTKKGVSFRRELLPDVLDALRKIGQAGAQMQRTA